MSALSNRHESLNSHHSPESTAAHAWIVDNHQELHSRARAQFARFDPERRDEFIAETIALTFVWALSAARRNKLHRVTPYWAVRFAHRQLCSGRRFMGTSRGCVMSEARRYRHRTRVVSLDQDQSDDALSSNPLRESLADRDAENPFDVVRRSIDYPEIFEMEEVSPKAVATFEYLAATKSEGPQGELAAELRVSPARITQLKDELGEALALHGYAGPLGPRSSVGAKHQGCE